MLEWNKQDVIVSRAHVADMEGHELCSMVRADPSTKEVRFVLIASVEEGTRAETSAAGIDLVLPSTMTAAMIVGLVVQLARHDLGTAANDPLAAILSAPAPQVVTPPAAPVPPAAVSLLDALPPSARVAPRAPVVPPPPPPPPAPVAPPAPAPPPLPVAPPTSEAPPAPAPPPPVMPAA